MMHRLLASIVGGLATTLLLANATFSQTAETEGILRATIIDQETSRPVRDVSVTLTGPLKPADFESLHRQLETFDFASAAIAGVDRTLATIIANWRKSATDTAISQRIAASDRNGMVVLHGVPAGDYLVGVERTGYFETFSNPADRSVFGRIVHLIGRQTTEMTIPVVPGASIGGRLRNANNPPAEVSVFVINYLYGIPILVPQATAPAGASYKLENLPPGEYLIGATGFPHVYHPSATDAHRATSVVIQGGETLSKIDIDYGAAKAGIVQMTKTLAAAWAKEGIRVNAVAPGLIRTKMTARIQAAPEYTRKDFERMPLARVPTGYGSKRKDIPGKPITQSLEFKVGKHQLSGDNLETLEHIHHIFELYSPQTGYASNLKTVDFTNGNTNGNFETVLTTTEAANTYAVAFGTDETGQGLGATVAVQNAGDVTNVVVTVAEGT